MIPICNARDFWTCAEHGCYDCQQKVDDAVDIWLAEAPEREQRQREKLDSEGYYDNPDNY